MSSEGDLRRIKRFPPASVIIDEAPSPVFRRFILQNTNVLLFTESQGSNSLKITASLKTVACTLYQWQFARFLVQFSWQNKMATDRYGLFIAYEKEGINSLYKHNTLISQHC